MNLKSSTACRRREQRQIPQPSLHRVEGRGEGHAVSLSSFLVSARADMLLGSAGIQALGLQRSSCWRIVWESAQGKKEKVVPRDSAAKAARLRADSCEELSRLPRKLPPQSFHATMLSVTGERRPDLAPHLAALARTPSSASYKARQDRIWPGSSHERHIDRAPHQRRRPSRVLGHAPLLRR